MLLRLNKKLEEYASVNHFEVKKTEEKNGPEEPTVLQGQSMATQDQVHLSSEQGMSIAGTILDKKGGASPESYRLHPAQMMGLFDYKLGRYTLENRI